MFFWHRSVLQALSQIANQTNIESQTHQTFGNEISEKISVPMKNLAETQSKARKPVNLFIIEMNGSHFYDHHGRVKMQLFQA